MKFQSVNKIKNNNFWINNENYYKNKIKKNKIKMLLDNIK